MGRERWPSIQSSHRRKQGRSREQNSACDVCQLVRHKLCGIHPLLILESYRKYDSGAVGTFAHVVALQGTNYSCELEVYADGYQFKSALPYVTSSAQLTSAIL